MDDLEQFEIIWSAEGYDFACSSCSWLLETDHEKPWQTLADFVTTAREHLKTHKESDRG